MCIDFVPPTRVGDGPKVGRPNASKQPQNCQRTPELFGLLASRMARSESYIVAFLHVFSPGSTKTFFPIRALFSAAAAGEWTGLAVLIAHG